MWCSYEYFATGCGGHRPIISSGHHSQPIWCSRSTEMSCRHFPYGNRRLGSSMGSSIYGDLYVPFSSYLFPFHSRHLHLCFSVSVFVGLSYLCLPFRKGRTTVPILVFLSVSSSDVLDNFYKRKPMYLSGFLYMFLLSFHPSIFHSSNECMYFKFDTQSMRN